ncbi:MAG: MlaD family protein [Paludibacteraceae bacterium]|nr:MlaD family protein [Paludibacteraceae bacterium]
MKHAREYKVAALAIVCAFLVYFGMYYLKGVNVFSPVKHYVGVFDNVSGLQEQAPVYVRGYKVGQVDKITYDYTLENAFTVTISMDKNIAIMAPSEMRLFDDGILGGKAIEVIVPVGSTDGQTIYAEGDTIATFVVHGLLETLQEGFMAKVDDALGNLDSLITKVNDQIGKDELKNTLQNLEQISTQLNVSARDIKEVTHNKLPQIIQNADTVVFNAKVASQKIKDVDLQATVMRVDNVVDTLQSIISTKEGTLGLLLNDKGLYQHIDSTVVSVDSLVTDLKANPKRYVHFSLFGAKDKSSKKKAK